MEWASRITSSNWFNYSITTVIILNAVVIGMDTSPALTERFGDWFVMANPIFLGIFIAEAAVKILAQYPRMHNYFTDGWNLFDFSIIVISLIPATGQLAMLARLARLLRVLHWSPRCPNCV